MRKFINFIKKPLLIISAFLFIVATVGVIVVSTAKHGKTYIADIDDSASEVIVTFKDNDTLEIETFITFSKSETDEFEYKITKRKLLIRSSSSDEWAYVGRVSSFELVMDYKNPITGKVVVMEFECETNEFIQDLFVTFMVASGIVFVCSLAVAILDKLGLLNSLENLGKSNKVEDKNNKEQPKNEADSDKK